MTTPFSARRTVVAKYARKTKNGRIPFCQPKPDEPESWEDGAVIYNDRETAEAAEAEFRALGADPQRAYECPRSRHGHHHLARMHESQVAT